MKVQESLSQYLYETKKLTLSGIGHFALDPSVNVYEKAEHMSLQHMIQFTPDTKETEDPDLISYLVKTTGKMRPLAISDLESLLSTGKQLLNIGKPFIIPGIGSLVKSKAGIEFTSGQYIPLKQEEKATEYKLRDKTVEEPNFSSVEKEFEYEEGTRHTSRRWLMVLATLLILALAGWSIYYFLFAPKEINQTVVSEEVQAVVDTALKEDTASLKITDSLVVNKPTSIAVIPDSVSYDYAIQLRQFTFLKSANERLDTLKSKGHKVYLEVQDSTHYNLLMPITGNLADSTRVIDSLSKKLLGPSSKRPMVRLKS
jgi:hypothetical protein